jgi:hypothetical protein
LAKCSCRKHIEFTFIIKMEGTWKIIFFVIFLLLLPVFLGCCSSSFSLSNHLSGKDLDFKVRACLHLLLLGLCCEKLIHIYMCSCCCLHLK